MENLYENIGSSSAKPLETTGGDFDIIAISVEPGHGTVPRGTVMYRKSGSVLYAPAAAAQIAATNALAVLRDDVDTEGSETVAAAAAAYIAGSLLATQVVLADGTTHPNQAQALVLRQQGIVLKPFDDLSADPVEADNEVEADDGEGE